MPLESEGAEKVEIEKDLDGNRSCIISRVTLISPNPLTPTLPMTSPLRPSLRVLAALAALPFAFLSGCSSGLQAGPDGSGGATPTGGSASSGGAATGGARASGGSSSTGGTSAGGAPAGGSQNSGGVPGSGGALSTGGANAGGTAAGGSANSGGADAGTGGGGSEFQPCPTDGPCKVLPLGDSITFGLGFDGGYRVELFHLANEDDHDITFTGTQSANGPTMVDGKPFSRNHEGISGQTISQIAGRVPSPAFRDDTPHIILVHAGTNDMYQMPSGATDRLGDLMDKLIDEAPDALIVFSNIIPFPQSASNVTAFNMPIQGMVEERAAAGAHILFVDQFKDFPTSELGDGVHPNQAGYGRMAAKWYAAIEPYLP